MPKGGARTRSGPAPDPNALRRDHDANEWIMLPAAGRTGRAPAWPLSKVSRRENTLWLKYWRLPQAVEWERQNQQVEVALYVRRLVEAEVPGSIAALSTLVRQLADSLGITQPGMRANRWRIAETEAPAAKAPAHPARSARDRFTVVQGG